MEHAKNVSFSYRHRPLTPSESVLWWSEYVIKTHGAPLTESIASHLPWYIYWSIDIYCVLLVVVTAAFMSWVYIYRKLFKAKKKPEIRNAHVVPEKKFK